MPAADKQFLVDFIKNPSINLDNPSHFTYAVTALKGGKDFFRRNRDLTIIAIAALHILSIIDASVDANLFDFDISNDLTLKVQPAPMQMMGGEYNYGNEFWLLIFKVKLMTGKKWIHPRGVIGVCPWFKH